GRGDRPEWELLVQMMSDDEHPELDFDPLDDTKTWPEQDFPPKPVGRIVLNRNLSNHFAENEQISFGTGVLVDGLDFSDDKMLIGRTFSYSDTQRYRVGANYLQLPVNAPKTNVRSNQHRGQMDFRDPGEFGENHKINYEPSVLGGLEEVGNEGRTPHEPEYNAKAVTEPIDRPNVYGQAGDTYRWLEDWERAELVNNLGDALAISDKRIQEEMVEHFTKADQEYGQRVKEAIDQKVKELESSQNDNLPGHKAGV